jgi:glutamate-ammonia-ligase adenylyltransferase
VKGTLRFLLAAAAKQAGLPDSPPEMLEQSTGLIILAMGKMGAFELNYSSDIDLIVFYDEDRFPFSRGGEKRIAAVDLVKGLIKLLAEPSADGYVFRVDLRLRPDAGATQIAIPTAAAELYYESMGQNWERAAWIKARQCAGDSQAGALFLKSMEPFVWRKSLDYAAIQDIHSIAARSTAMAGIRASPSPVTTSSSDGGIRGDRVLRPDQQLILGGRDRGLRDSTTLGALAALNASGHISLEAQRDMADSYRFLRTVEHRLQMIDDQQTHTLPKTPDGLDHVARFTGFADPHEFEQALRAKLVTVQSHYARLFESEAPLASQTGSLVFTGVEEDPETLATLGRMGFERPADISAIIRGWHHGRIPAPPAAPVPARSLTKLMPALLEALAKTADPLSAFTHFDRFLSRLPSGVQVFSMLLANPRLLDLIAEIAGSAPKLADYLGRHAGVLDALIDPGFLTEIPSRAELESRFAAELARVSGYEAALDAARRFAKEESFRIGVQIIQGMGDAERRIPPARRCRNRHRRIAGRGGKRNGRLAWARRGRRLGRRGAGQAWRARDDRGVRSRPRFHLHPRSRGGAIRWSQTVVAIGVFRACRAALHRRAHRDDRGGSPV